MYLLAVGSLLAPFLAAGEPIRAELLNSDDACLKSDGEDCSVELLQGQMRKHMGQDAGKESEGESLVGSAEEAFVPKIQTPYSVMPCKDSVLTTPKMSGDLYDKVIRTVMQALEGLPDTCTPTNCPQADVSGCIVRMAGHDFMDYRPDVGLGGSDACLDLKEPDNNGLARCVVNGDFGVSVYDMYKEFCDKISLADFIVMAAEGAMTFTRRIYLKEFPSRKEISFKDKFLYGRTTAIECDFSTHILPNPEESCSDVQRVFLDNLGLTWTGAAALMGVHTLGRAKIQNSGYDGWWSDAENSRRFNNDYFVSLVTKGWMPERKLGGNKDKNQWINSNFNYDEEVHGKQMMLDTDLCLLYSNSRNKYEEIRAADHSCCAWTIPSAVPKAVELYAKGEFCGESENVTEFWGALATGKDDADRIAKWKQFEAKTGEKAMTVFTDIREACCRGNRAAPDCGGVTHPTGPAAHAVFEFADDDGLWQKEFLNAWRLVTNIKGKKLKPLDQ